MRLDKETMKKKQKMRQNLNINQIFLKQATSNALKAIVFFTKRNVTQLIKTS